MFQGSEKEWQQNNLRTRCFSSPPRLVSKCTNNAAKMHPESDESNSRLPEDKSQCKESGILIYTPTD